MVTFYVEMELNSSVGIGTGCVLNGQGSIPDRGKDFFFSIMSRSDLGSTQLCLLYGEIVQQEAVFNFSTKLAIKIIKIRYYVKGFLTRLYDCKQFLQAISN
jgi:hypothetical protein